MTSTANVPQIRTLSLNALVLSQSPVQVERRSLIDYGHIKEMSVTIKKNGRVEQPITVRPFGELDQFEVVDGEHRVMATEEAGLAEILAEIRELTDEQVEEIQIITGLQKVKLHELVEAEGYEVLHRRGMSVDDIAAKVGKTKATVYARMKLLALTKEARAAFRGGKVSASVALVLARIPLPNLQHEALKEFVRRSNNGEYPISYREAWDYVQRSFTLRLAGAPFDTGDETLLKNTPACGRCPKNTSCSPELFADVSTKDALCTDRTCFAQKKAAAQQRQIEKAEAGGQKVIQGKEAKKVAPHGIYSLKEGYARLDETCREDPKYRTFRQLLGRKAKPDLLDVEDELVPVINKAEALKQLRADGVLKVEKRTSTPTASGSQKVANEKAKRDQEVQDEYEKRLFLAVRAKAPKQWPREILLEVADLVLDAIGSPLNELIQEAYGWQAGAGIAELKKLNDAQLYQLVFEIFATERASVEKSARDLKIDTKKILAETKAALKAPALPEKLGPRKGPKKVTKRK